MKTAYLPETIHPSRLALSGKEINGTILILDLIRFKQLLVSDEGLIECKLRAYKDEQKRVMVLGSIEATVEMNCQLCLKPMAVQLQQNFELMVVENDQQAAEIIDKYEPLLVDHERVLLKELIEDEAILALPLTPTHSLEIACQRHKNFSSVETTKTTPETKQPFANLKSLMEKPSDIKD